ncbi:MAG: hypothetical protein ABI435_04915 [Pseudolysinimonas sp.]
MNSRIIFGSSIYDDHMVHAAPEGLVVMPELDLDPELMSAIAEVVMASFADENLVIEGQVSSALHWHARTWENNELHTASDVVVNLKTAIEALSGEHQTRSGIPVLDGVYSAIERTHGAHAYLWDSASPHFPRTYRETTTDYSAFGNWFWHLADDRNMIVHSTAAPESIHVAQGSPFEGPIIRVAERVTRELIKIRLAQLGHPRAALTTTSRRLLDAATTQGLGDQLALISPI